MKSNNLVVVRLENDLKEKLEAKAKKLGLSLSALVRMTLIKEVDQ